MQELIIELNINQNNYKNGLLTATGINNVFKYTRYRSSFVFGCFAVLSFVVSLIIAYKNSDFGFLVFITAISMLVALVMIFVSIFEYWRLKKAIDIHSEAIIGKKCSVNLSDNTIKVFIGDETYIEKWEAVKNAKLMDEYIFFSTKEKVYFFPKMSMLPDEFKNFKEFITEAIK